VVDPTRLRHACPDRDIDVAHAHPSPRPRWSKRAETRDLGRLGL